MQTFFAFIMAVTPAFMLIRYYYRQDQDRPEPKRLVMKIFLLGIIYTLPVYLLEQVVGQLNVFSPWSVTLFYFFEAFIVAGLCEEYIKFRIIKKYIYHHPEFNKMLDGITYTIVASLGFACMENVLYVMKSSWHTALARGFTAIPMHAVCSGMMGYYIGLARFACDKDNEDSLLNQGLWTAILLHGLYDFLLFISPMWGSVFSFFAIILILWVYLLLKEKIHVARSWDTKNIPKPG